MRRVPVRAVQVVGVLAAVAVALWVAVWLVRNF